MPAPSPTSITYTALDDAFAFFNHRLFEGRLPACLITIQRTQGAYGYFAGGRFGSKDGKEITDEIALNPVHFEACSTEQSLSTLVHEMTHLEQHHFGKPSRAGYHNREWAGLMRAVGLIPSSTGEAGGRDIGQRVSHYIESRGRFEVACAELIGQGFKPLYVERWNEEGERARKAKAASKTRYTCPNCSTNAWAKPDMRLVCGRCRVDMDGAHRNGGRMSAEFQVIQLAIDEGAIQKAKPRLRNQLIGCMHAHNELTALNRILMFSMNDTGEGELHDSAQSVQMWCLLQVLGGKLFETWNMLVERFLTAQPEDPALTGLSAAHRIELDWLKDYFGVDKPKDNTLRLLRDKTAFHYDKLNLTVAAENLAPGESTIYLAQHPANALYYVGSSLVFRTVFSMIADRTHDPAGRSHGERTNAGFNLAIEEVQLVNVRLHTVLYGLIAGLLEKVIGRPLSSLEQLRIPIVGAPSPENVGLPTFIDIGNQIGDARLATVERRPNRA